MRLARNTAPFLLFAAIAFWLPGLILALWQSPADYLQGETVRIMYIHVPSAWLALFCYALMGGAAISALIFRHIVADCISIALAPVGAGFTLLCLVSGSLWGHPTWGSFWEWDARLTSVLVLFLFYLGYMLLLRAFDDVQRGIAAGRFLLIIGLINLPIVKFSVDWWNTLHQPASLSRFQLPAIHTDMLWPLFLMAGGFFCFFLWLLLIRSVTTIMERQLSS